jgi:putative transposase
MRTVSAAPVAANPEGVERLPAAVQEALGELAGAAKEGLLALSVGVGLGVLHALMEAEVDEVVGPKGKHDPDRTVSTVWGTQGQAGAAAAPVTARVRR